VEPAAEVIAAKPRKPKPEGAPAGEEGSYLDDLDAMESELAAGWKESDETPAPDPPKDA
jgi:hypothetical protein